MNSYVSCGFKAQLAEGSFTLVAGVHVQLQQRGEGSKNNFEASTYIHRGSKNKYLRHPKKQNIPLESLVFAFARRNRRNFCGFLWHFGSGTSRPGRPGNHASNRRFRIAMGYFRVVLGLFRVTVHWWVVLVLSKDWFGVI